MNTKPITQVSETYFKKDIDGNLVDIKDIQKVLLEILLELDRICRKNNIAYALSFGSALGIVNYAGFIPWDDDIDVMINYEDYSRFLEALNKDLSDQYYYDCYEKDKRYNPLIPALKLRKKNTYINEINWMLLPNRCLHDGIFIDVCLLMGVPSNEKEHLKLIKYSKRRMPLIVGLNSFLHLPLNRTKKKLKEFEKKTAEQYKNSTHVAQTVIIPFQDWGLGNRPLSYPKEVIYPFKEYDFMGHKIFSFNDVEKFCIIRYGKNSLNQFIDGKWQNLYPSKKRKWKHFRKFSLLRDK